VTFFTNHKSFVFRCLRTNICQTLISFILFSCLEILAFGVLSYRQWKSKGGVLFAELGKGIYPFGMINRSIMSIFIMLYLMFTLVALIFISLICRRIEIGTLTYFVPIFLPSTKIVFVVLSLIMTLMIGSFGVVHLMVYIR